MSKRFELSFNFIPTIDYRTVITPSTNTIFTTYYEPSNGTWGEGLNEENVCLAYLKHTSSITSNN